MTILLSPLALALLCGVLVTLAVVTDDRRDPPGPEDPDEPADPEQHDDRNDVHRPRSPRPRPAALGLLCVGLLAVGLTLASASTLGSLRSTELHASRTLTPPRRAGDRRGRRRRRQSDHASYCARVTVSTTSAALVDVAVSVRVTSETSNGPSLRYCAEVTVTTSASERQRWRATVGSTTPGFTASKYRLTTAPGLAQAEQVAFTGGNRWTLAARGDATQPVVRAGSPAVWTYCS